MLPSFPLDPGASKSEHRKYGARPHFSGYRGASPAPKQISTISTIKSQRNRLTFVINRFLENHQKPRRKNMQVPRDPMSSGNIARLPKLVLRRPPWRNVQEELGFLMIRIAILWSHAENSMACNGCSGICFANVHPLVIEDQCPISCARSWRVQVYCIPITTNTLSSQVPTSRLHPPRAIGQSHVGAC